MESKKKKMLISFSLILLVTLILIGVAYAYYRTRIVGNENSKSIGVQSTKLELVYGNGSANILTSDSNFEPSNVALGTKDFTVTNNGLDTEYVVLIEDVEVTNVNDNTSTEFVSNDFRYTLTCTTKDSSRCDGVEDQTVFPINGGILLSNKIAEDDVHNYILTLYYIETGVNQSDDMGKTLQAKVNIADITSANPFSANVNLLSYNIVNNSINKTNGTPLLASPLSKVGEESVLEYEESIEEQLTYDNNYSLSSLMADGGTFYSSDYDILSGVVNDLYAGSEEVLLKCFTNDESGNIIPSGNKECGDLKFDVPTCEDINNKYFLNPTLDTLSIQKATNCNNNEVEAYNVVVSKTVFEKELSISPDDYGISSYYRGVVEDNYVDFAGMCWKIVRIQGDGTIKLVLEDQDSTCAVSNGNWNIATTTNGTTLEGNYGYDYAKRYDEFDAAYTYYDFLINYLHGNKNNDVSMVTAFKNFQNQLSIKISNLYNLPIENFLKNEWCFNKNLKYVESIDLVSLKCTGEILKDFDDSSKTSMYIGGLNIYEVMHAGSKLNEKNPNNYLVNSYQDDNVLSFWLLDHSETEFYSDTYDNGMDGTLIYDEYQKDLVFSLDKYGSLNTNSVDSNLSFRPSIILKSNVEISSGDGTQTNPYVIK